MFETLLVRPDSLQNVVRDGEIVGFRFAVRISDYRGAYASLVSGFYVRVDGVTYPRNVQSLSINQHAPRDMETLKSAVNECWNYDDEGFVYIEKAGGLEAGVHHMEYQQCILNAYGYRPQDEEWVRTPPELGKGFGAGKTPVVVRYELPLQEGCVEA